jgi:hypothetical protein
MTRGDFFKAASLLVASVASIKIEGQQVSSKKVKDVSKTKVIVDLNTINCFHDVSASRILEIYNETGIFVYNGNRGDRPQFLEDKEIVISASPYQME